MQHIWLTIYSVIGLFALWQGHQSLAPQNTANTNADWVFVTCCFVGCLLVPSLSLTVTSARGSELIPRPSLHRRPVGFWRTDPLQLLRLTVLWALCEVIGALSALAKTDQKGVMIFWSSLAVAFGLLLGERFAHLLFKRRIACHGA